MQEDVVDTLSAAKGSKSSGEHEHGINKKKV